MKDADLPLYILVDRKPVRTSNLEEWADWFESGADIVVGVTYVGPTCISTTFLGVAIGQMFFGDAAPARLFETMIFGSQHDGRQWRYTTWEEAEAGHEHAVALVISGALH